MAISTNAMTLADYCIISKDPVAQAISWSLIESGIVAQDIPFVNKATLIANGLRWEGDNLPSVDWVAINQEGTTTTGTPTPYQERVKILRNYIDTDKLLVQDQNQITDPRAARAAAYLRALAYDFNYQFMNNTEAADPNSVIGIRARLDNPTTYGVNSGNKINGGGVDLRQANATQATANQFLEYLDQLLWSVNSVTGENVVFYMNEVMLRRFHFALRLMGTSGGLTTSVDQFNRVITRYKGAILRDIGYKADQTTRIITSTEDTSGNDGSSSYTSIYAVHYGTTQFYGWQFAPPDFRDMGLLENGVIYRTMIDWTCGLMSGSNRSIGRLYGIRLST
jgi:hypothetical protein